MAEVLLEMYEDAMVEREDLERGIDDDDPGSSHARGRIAAIDEFLGEKSEAILDVKDPLVDKWEREFAEGKVPNLDEEMH